MRIQDIAIRAYLFPLDASTGGDGKVAAREVLTIEIRTSDGACGVGYLTGAARPGLAPDGQEVAVIKTILDRILAPMYVGRRVFERERLWSEAHRATLRYGGKGAVTVALAGLDIAMWDLAARYAGVPLAELLGGYRRSVPAYVLCGAKENTPESVGEEVSRLVDDGFTMIKMKVGSRDLRQDLARTEAAVAACGRRAKIIVDANESWTVSQAAEYMWQARDLGLLWVEEPIPVHDVNGYRHLKAGSHLALAVGDLESDPRAFRPYVSEGLIGFTHADATRIGGVTPWMKLAAVADMWNVQCSAHSVTEVHTHTVAAVSNGAAVEYFEPGHRAQWPLDRLFPNAPELRTIRDGMMLVPDVPGLGLVLDVDAGKDFEITV